MRPTRGVSKRKQGEGPGLVEQLRAAIAESGLSLSEHVTGQAGRRQHRRHVKAGGTPRGPGIRGPASFRPAASTRPPAGVVGGRVGPGPARLPRVAWRGPTPLTC